MPDHILSAQCMGFSRNLMTYLGYVQALWLLSRSLFEVPNHTFDQIFCICMSRMVAVLSPFGVLELGSLFSFLYDMVSLFDECQTKSKLYLILDFINGGHLFFQLYRQGTFR